MSLLSKNADGTLTMPGLIDCHVHFREPGLTHKATMRSEADAAIAGGVTTVCEMPNTNPPTTTVAALADKVRRAYEIEDCDIRFYFGVTEGPHLAALRELWQGESDELRRLKKRCCGLKLYLDHSTGNQKVQEDLVGDIFAACGELAIPLVAHCEDPAMNAAAAAANTRTDIAAHSDMRPAESEGLAIERAIAFSRQHKAALHVAHLSTAQGVALVREAKKEGLPVTCEVAPHHLFLTVDDYAQLGTRMKMNPPIRSLEHVASLWEGISDGTVDCIATDHAPHTIEEKSNPEPLKAPSGVPGVETMLPLLLTVAAGSWPREGDAWGSLSYDDIVRLCFENPNRIFRLGRDAAIGPHIVIDPDAEWTIEGKNLHSLCGWTPFEGWKVKGKIVKVLR